MEALRPSLDEASHGKDLNTKEAALDYIGRRALGQTTSRANRIKHAQEIVIRELLPHIGITGTMCVRVYVCVCARACVCRSESHACACAEENLTKKQYFLGYICHRLLACSLGRRAPDDRDHYGNKVCDGES